MAPLLALVAAVAVSQAPDFIDARPSGDAQQVLAAGGWLYRSTPGGKLALTGGLDGPASAFTGCANGTAIAVGRKGLVRVVDPGGRVQPRTTGDADLWDVAHDGCDELLMVGDAGLFQGSLTGTTARRVSGVPTTPLYGVALHDGRATAVGAAGVAVHRASREARWKPVPSQTQATLLAVHQHADGAVVVAGEGGLWRGDARGLTQMWRDDREVFLQLAFASDELGVALGQSVVLVTWNGGRTWTRFDKAGWLAAAPASRDGFFLYGRDGAVERFVPGSPPPATKPQTAPQPPRVAERAEPVPPAERPSSPPAPSASTIEPRADEPARTPELPLSCRSAIPPKGVSGAGFVDLRRVGGSFVLAGADGTVRRYGGDGRMQTVATPGVPMLGVAVDASGSLVAVTGFGKLALSTNGGRTWKVEETPHRRTVFAAAFVGRTLLAFDDVGGGHRRALDGNTEGTWTPLDLPLAATFYSARFVDAERGYVVGECGALLQTLDAGKSWRALKPPVPDALQGVLAVGERLYVSTDRGVWLSKDRGASWTHALEVRNCIRFDVDATNSKVAVACGDVGQPLWVTEVAGSSGDERRFQKVKLDRVVHLLLAPAFDAAGGLVAVGPSEVVVKAEGTNGKIAYDSDASREGLARAQWLWNELRRSERPRPAKVVSAPATAPTR